MKNVRQNTKLEGWTSTLPHHHISNQLILHMSNSSAWTAFQLVKIWQKQQDLAQSALDAPWAVDVGLALYASYDIYSLVHPKGDSLRGCT